jgi:hypothetical protein
MKIKWFIVESYKYINPEGLWQHVRFGVGFPWAMVKFYYYWFKDEYYYGSR